VLPPLNHAQADAAADVLAAICDPALNLAIWERDLSADIVADAQELTAKGAKLFVLEHVLDGMDTSLSNAIQAADWPHAPHLRADIAALAARFSAIMDTPAISLRLEVVEGDACRKFHADFVTARLITSYAGPGSQWLANDEAEALASGSPPERLNIHTLKAGDVALFKGRRWTDTPIIHRSPPIAGTGQRRLVLVINPVDPGSLA
jgi:hypothetical protein